MKELDPSAIYGAFLIGASYEFRFNGGETYEKREETYALLLGLKTVTVITESEGSTN